MIDYSLSLCYGIIVSDDIIKEIAGALTDEDYDEMIDNYARCLNSWTSGDYFIGVINDLTSADNDSVYYISNLITPADNANLIGFMQFFTQHDLWQYIDWKPELILINFCH